MPRSGSTVTIPSAPPAPGAGSAVPHDVVLQAIRIVLVRPRGAENVGATARAMKNMGFRDLTLVRPELRRRFWAQAMAVHAGDVLASARTVDSLVEAVADCGLVVGTTCRGGLYRCAADPPRAIAPEILACASNGPVALVFGPEDHGLTNADLKYCQRLITIPTTEEYPSLNLAQAVLLCCYEIREEAWSGREMPQREPLARAADVEFALDRLQASLLSIGFLNRDNPEHIMFAFRRVFGRAGLEERDVQILLGLARQIEWYEREGRHRGLDGSASNG
jgi:tRNA/rRNA methyltransferase